MARQCYRVWMKDGYAGLYTALSIDEAKAQATAAALESTKGLAMTPAEQRGPCRRLCRGVDAMIDESIRNKFDCREGKGQYTIACRHCSHKWTHPDKPMAVGTILHLLDHAASHEKKQ